MTRASRLRVIVVYNRDFDLRPLAEPAEEDPLIASRRDVENAAGDVARALASRGHDVQTLAVTCPPGDVLRGADRAVRELAGLAPQLVFNLCESMGGDARREAVLPELMDLAGLRYTGSGPLGLALALRKDLAKQILRAASVPTPEAVVVDGTPGSIDLAFPLIVKPVREDASAGIEWSSVVFGRGELEARVAEVHARFHQPALVERYVDGRELYVSLVGGEPLPMHEIDFSTLPPDCPRIVTYLGKWDQASLDYRATRPVRAEGLDAPLRERCHEVARAAFAALELRDYARIDLRLTAGGTPYVIDVNPNCDLSEGAGVARAAAFGGVSYPELIERICQVALGRYRSHPAHQKESTPHVDRGTDAAHQAPPAAEPAHPPAPQAERPRRARAADPPGLAVHEGGGVGRPRAHRRRAR